MVHSNTSCLNPFFKEQKVATYIPTHLTAELANLNLNVLTQHFSSLEKIYSIHFYESLTKKNKKPCFYFLADWIDNGMRANPLQCSTDNTDCRGV